MSDLRSLLAAVLDNPADDLPRLAYADLTEEGGDEGGEARAEFIRLQLADIRPDRQEELLAAWAMDWLPDGVQASAEAALEWIGGTRWLVGDATDVGRFEVEFARGFITSVVLPDFPAITHDEFTGGIVADGFTQSLMAVFEENPVERLALRLHGSEDWRIEKRPRPGGTADEPGRWACRRSNVWAPSLIETDDRDEFAEQLREEIIERIEGQARLAFALWQTRGERDEG